LLLSLGEGVDTLAEQPLVQGLTRPFKYNESLGESAVGVLKSVPASFVPTLLNQIKQLTDNTSRNVKDENPIQEAKKLAMNKIPGLSKKLQPNIDTFGKEREIYQDGSNNVFNVLLNPSFASRADVTPEAKMVLDIYKKTGETQQAPRLVPTSQTISVKGEEKTIKLTPIQQTKMQRYVGETTQRVFAKIVENERFAQQPEEDKAKYLAGILSDINTAAKIQILGHRPKKTPARVRKLIKQFPQ
jgi:hypothetical protein